MDVTILACSSRLTGTVQLSETADDRSTGFNKPIAVGGYLDIEATDIGALQPVELLAAASDDAETLGVVSFSDSTSTMTGVAESVTPDSCAVEAIEPSDASTYEYGWFEIIGAAEGEWLFTVTDLAGNSGAGTSAQFSGPIEPEAPRQSAAR